MAGKKGTKRRWVRESKSASTYPPEGTFAKDAESIARSMASKRVSPDAIGSGIRMIQFVINRAGRILPAERKLKLERAKELSRAKMKKQEPSSSVRSDI